VLTKLRKRIRAKFREHFLCKCSSSFFTALALWYVLRKFCLRNKKVKFFIRPPGTAVPKTPYVLQKFFFYFQREISDVSWPIAAKFCIMLGRMFHFITPVQKFGAAPQKIEGGRKTR